MKSFRSILVPTDLGAPATYALGYAIEFAKNFGASLTLYEADLFVPSLDVADTPADFYLEQLPALKAGVERRLEQYATDQIPQSIRYTTTVVAAAAAPAIVKEAQSGAYDLVVMGTHGRTGLRRAILGSVTETVFHEIDTPLLTIRHHDEYVPRIEQMITSVICPVNLSNIARESLHYAEAVARAFNARLVVLQVVEPEHRIGRDYVDLQEWLPETIRDIAECKQLELHTHPAEQILAFAHEIGANFIVLGAQHRRFVDTTIIGSTSEKVMRYAPCPVLNVVRRKTVPASTADPEEEKVVTLI